MSKNRPSSQEFKNSFMHRVMSAKGEPDISIDNPQPGHGRPGKGGPDAGIPGFGPGGPGGFDPHFEGPLMGPDRGKPGKGGPDMGIPREVGPDFGPGKGGIPGKGGPDMGIPGFGPPQGGGPGGPNRQPGDGRNLGPRQGGGRPTVQPGGPDPWRNPDGSMKKPI